MFNEQKKKYNKLLGKNNYLKGYYAEYLIINQLKYNAYKKDIFFKTLTNNLPLDFNFTKFKSVWTYKLTPDYAHILDIDIYARANEGEYSIICEVKNRESTKFSLEEVIKFNEKVDEIKKIEQLKKNIGFIFSREGFTKDAEKYCKDNKIAYSCDEKWLDAY